MKKLINKTLLNEKVFFIGNLAELKKVLNKDKGRKFRLEWISDRRFKFLAIWSFGTGVVSGAPGYLDGIKGYGTVVELGGQIEIHLETRIRVEMYIISGSYFSLFVLSLFIEVAVPIWIYFMLPFMLIWFWGVYRYQENKLFDKFKAHINKTARAD